jgi:LPS-assembly lipoprotein
MFRDGSSTLWPRRALLGGLLLAGGCGFRPLYGPAAPGQASAALAGVQVANIPERSGQILRQALARRLDPQGAGGAPRHELRVALASENEPLGFRRDGVPSRVRVSARADWRLVLLGPPQSDVAAGRERTFDSYNIPDGQFFAADASRDAMERRLMEQLAELIVQRLAVTLRQAG